MVWRKKEMLQDEVLAVLDGRREMPAAYDWAQYTDGGFDEFLLKQEMCQRAKRMAKFLDKYFARIKITNKDIANHCAGLLSSGFPRGEFLASSRKIYDALTAIVPSILNADDFDTLMEFLNYFTYNWGTGRFVTTPDEELLELLDGSEDETEE